MLNMYTDRSLVPSGIEIIKSNDAFFGAFNFVLLDDELTRKALEEVEEAKYYNKIFFLGKFGYSSVRSTDLSTGTKTILNIKNYPDKCFNLVECGYNAEQFIFNNLSGNVIIKTCTLASIITGRSYSLNGRVIKNADEMEAMLNEINYKK